MGGTRKFYDTQVYNPADGALGHLDASFADYPTTITPSTKGRGTCVSGTWAAAALSLWPPYNTGIYGSVPYTHCSPSKAPSCTPVAARPLQRQAYRCNKPRGAPTPSPTHDSLVAPACSHIAWPLLPPRPNTAQHVRHTCMLPYLKHTIQSSEHSEIMKGPPEEKSGLSPHYMTSVLGPRLTCCASATLRPHSNSPMR